MQLYPFWAKQIWHIDARASMLLAGKWDRKLIRPPRITFNLGNCLPDRSRLGYVTVQYSISLGIAMDLILHWQAGLRCRSCKEDFGWSQRIWGGVGFLKTPWVEVGFFYPTRTREVQLKHFLHRTTKLGILTRARWNGTISFETFIEAGKSCLIASCYKTSYLQLENPAS